MRRFFFPTRFFCMIMVYLWVCPAFSGVQEPPDILTLKQTIDSAIKANLDLKLSKEETAAALAVKKSRFTNFLPTFSTKYQYNKLDEGTSIGGFATSADKEYSFVTSVTQPLFAGFSILRQYDIAKLGLNAAEIREKLMRQNIILDAKTVYFSLLKTQKLRKIAEETVVQINAQVKVAENFYQVGMSPLNDLLQAQVELANAKQELIVARNTMENAEADFNTLLRRPVNTTVSIEDILDYSSFEKDLEYCLAQAKKNRLEIKIANFEVQIAEKELQLAKKDYFPTINLEGNYFREGDDWDVDGGEGIFDSRGWNILAVARWNFFEWGRTYYGTNEKRSRLSQAQFQKDQILDNIQQEVKKAYLRTQEAERAIITVEKAIEQAKENYRINEERYKQQVATSTDVLDAQTLLSRTMTNYYSALYEFQIAKSTLYRVMGHEIVDSEEQAERLKSFLRNYCQTYENKDLDKFAGFFTPDAVENNRPFKELLPQYRKNMKKIDSFNYRIELLGYSLQADTETLNVQGKYVTRYLLHEGTWKENNGNISMELIMSGDSYLVKKLSYTTR